MMQKKILSQRIKDVSDKLDGSIFEMDELKTPWPKGPRAYLKELSFDLKQVIDEIEKN